LTCTVVAPVYEDLPDDTYVEMQPGMWLPPAPPIIEEPLYVEMSHTANPPAREDESLYYACSNLFAQRPELTVEVSHSWFWFY